MSDYITGLRRDLVEAAARQEQRSPSRRAMRQVHPRAWSPVTLLGAGAAVAGLLLLVLTLRAVSPPRPPEALKVVGTFHIGGSPRDAVAAGGVLVVADLSGRVARVSPADPQARRVLVDGQPQSVAADGESIWVVSNDAPRSYLLQLDARTGRRLARVAMDGYQSYVAVGAGGVWLADLHSGGLARFDPRTRRRTLFVPKVVVEGLAATDRSVWLRAGSTVTQRDAGGRVMSRVGGISPTLGDESQRTLLPDADGAWVVGSSAGLLYRIEHGRVVRRLTVGDTAGVIAGSGSTVWVSASPGVDRYELVRIDAEDRRVTGRVSIGRYSPQAIVPLGKDVWVVTNAGDLLRVSEG